MNGENPDDVKTFYFIGELSSVKGFNRLRDYLVGISKNPDRDFRFVGEISDKFF